MNRETVKRYQGILAAILLLILTAFPTYGADLTGWIDDGVQRSYNSGSGLLSTAATAIAQTDDGFIWIGGYGGLVRYDGTSFEPVMEGGLAGVQALLPDKDGALWIATNDQGLIYYKNHEGTYLSQLEGNEPADAACIARGQDGTIWFGTENGIGTVDADFLQTMKDVPAIDGEFIIHILPLANGRLLVVTRSGMLFWVNGSEAEQIDLGADSRNVRSVVRDEMHDRFLVGTQDARFLILDRDGRLLETVETEGLDCINDIYIDENGIIWLCSDSGIGSYDDGKLRIQSLDLDNSIDGMIVDHEGSFWFISSRQGVLQVSPCRFSNISRSAGLPELVVNAIVREGDRLYIGHDEGLTILDSANFDVLSDPAFGEVSHVRIRSIVRDGSGGLFFMTKGKGVLHYDAERKLTAYSSEEYPVIESDVFRCASLSGGTLIAGTDIGAYLIKGGEVLSAVEESEQFDHRVLCAWGSPDHFWLGTDGYGLYEVRDRKIAAHIGAEDGLGSNVVMKIVPSSDGDGLWLVLGNGLVMRSYTGDIRRISAIPSKNVLDFLRTPDGTVWIPTGAGIFTANEQELLAEEEPVIGAYRQSDGLPYEITANSNQCLEDGKLYLCGTGGIAALQLSYTDTGDKDYPLVLDTLYEDGKQVFAAQGENVMIEPGVRRVDFDAHVLSFQTDNPYIYYWLEGFDSVRNVRRLSDFGGITYTNLDAGIYTLHFGLTNASGEETFKELTLNITKLPQWYENPFVRIAAALAGLGLIAVLAVYITKRRVRREEQRLKLAYEERERERLKEIAFRDYLTGLYNRNYLTEWSDKILPNISWPLCFVAMDCNDLKKINDSYGHKQGDLLLSSLAKLLAEEFAEDAATVFRTGGDEFLILAGGSSEEEIRERVARVAEKAKQVQIEDVTLSFCSGVCEMDEAGFDLEKGIRLSDLELLKEKDRFHERV